ncbi:MAG: arylesterase [Opitutales bacterium]|nr:arylesterase [Opitutales bacterium]
MKRGKKILIAVVALLLALAFIWTRVQAAEPEPEPVRVLAFGDSLTAGYGLDPEDAYPALLEAIARDKGFHLTVRNAGLSGETTAGGLRRIGWVLRQPVDVLILALGANDALRGQDPEATENNLRTIIAEAREAHPDVTILLAGMFAPPNLGSDYRRAFDGIFPRIAEDEEVRLVPFLLEGVAGDPSLNQADGIHPTREGQRIMARTVWAELHRALEDSAPGAG